MATFDYHHQLVVTSPLVSGPRVKEAQKLLAGGGPVYKAKWYKGKIDGQYGHGSAQATHRAKYWLGYPKRECNGKFGEVLYEYLTGKKKISAFMKWRRNHRIKLAKKNAQTGGLYKKAITLAAHFIGVKESPPGSNDQMFGKWYGENGVPWCAIFQSYILSHCGRPFRYAYVPAIVADAKLGRNKMRTIAYSEVAANIKAGHPVLVCFDWNHDGIADHVGMVEKVVDGTTFQTIEGNTGDTNFSNGGEVMRATRYTSEVQAFVLIYS